MDNAAERGGHWQGCLPSEGVCVVPGGLYEREGELARVDALLAATRAGRGGVLLVTGPAGIGKTVLLGAARERAGQAGMRVLAGAARRALIALEGQADAAQTAGNEPPFGVMHGLYWLAVNASEAGPVLVTVDDLHWADQASLRFLLYLTDRLAGLPIALALSWRTAEAADGGDRLARLEQIAADRVV